MPVAILLLLGAAALTMLLAADDAQAFQISTDTTYSDESLVFTEDVEVVGGADLVIRDCDLTFRPPASAPLQLRVMAGTLTITDTDIRGEGVGFIVLSHGDATLKNVTASGLGAVANSSLAGRGLPITAQGGFMFYGCKVDLHNVDISSARATAVYAEDCDIRALSLGTRDTCTAYTGTDQSAAVVVAYMGVPLQAHVKLTAVLNSTKIESSSNHGLMLAAVATGFDATVSVLGTDISTSGGSGLVVVETYSHGTFTVTGDTNEIHHSKGDGILWVRKTASGGEATMRLAKSRIYSNQGSAMRVLATGSADVADLELDRCVITDTQGDGVTVSASSGCTQTLNVTLRDCTVSGCKGTGLTFVTDGDGKTSSYHMRLVGTTLEDSGSRGIYTKITQSYCFFNLTLEGSKVLRSASDGIYTEYRLVYFDYYEAPSVTSNLTVSDSQISNNRGYGVYDTRFLQSYYSWAQTKATLYATVNVLGSTISNHTKSAIVVTPPSQLQYTTYASEAYLIDSTFTNNTGHGYYEKVDSLTIVNGGSTRAAWFVRGCTFTDLKQSGVYLEVRRADQSVINFDVVDSTFSNLGDYGAILTAPSAAYVGNVFASVRDSAFSDLGRNAYYLSPNRPGDGGDDFHVVLSGLRVQNTTGIYVSLDGYSAEDAYELTVEGVNVTRTRGNAIEVLVHPYQSARMETTLKDVYCRDTNGTALSITYTSDRSMSLWGDMVGEDITLIDQVGGLLLYEHTGTITDLLVRGSTDFDLHKVDNRVPPDGTGILELHSAFLSRSKVKVVGSGALWVFNALTVKVEWQNGLAALDAGVQVQDRTFEVVAVGHVDSEDGMEPVELLAYILDADEFRSRSPFIVNITFLDLEQTGVCSLDEPATVRIVMHDRVAPSMVILDPDDGAAQRASNFELRGSAFDAHAGLHFIRYRLDGGEWVMVGATSPFRTTVEGVEPGPHELEVEISDRAGNVAREVVHIEIDNQPPHLVVVSPEGDVFTRDPSLTVRGETEEGASLSINGIDVETLSGLFIATVHLEEGTNTITVVSLDRLSNVATVRFIATLDTVEPFLDVHSHEDGDWVAQTSVTLVGVVEAGCTLTVNGKSVTVDDQNFSATLSLSLGENAVTLRAVDPAGNVATVVLHLYMASEPPWLHIESPDEGAIFPAPEVRVLGTVQPGSLVSINGRRATIKQGLIDELLILPEGDSTIVIEAEDPAGTLFTLWRHVTVDTIDPVLTLDQLPARTREGVIVVSGLVEGAALLSVNDVPVEIDANGTFRFNVTLAEGMNTIKVLARDGVGHEDRASAEVVRDSTPPFLRLVLPGEMGDGNGSWVSDTTTVNILVVSEPGASVTLNGIYILVGEDGTASYDLPLREDGKPTRVVVLAVDDLGNSLEVEYDILYQGRATGVASLDMLTILSTVVIAVLVAVMIVTAVRYRALVKRMSRRRRGPRPPNGSRSNGNGNGGVG